ncbi:PAS and ANTAR domain-containing protein [Nocardia sp. IFM 10818]
MISGDDEHLGTDPGTAIEKVVAVGEEQTVGWFRFWFDDQRWEWSDEVARMHGYAPGEVTPTTELLLAHKHPDDRDRVSNVIVTSVHDHEPFTSSHRIVDTAGREHQVIVVSDSITDDEGAIIGTAGYYIDVTAAVTAQRNHVVDELLPDLVEHRGIIEQAKGMLMMAYGVGADQAFRVLTWRSQATNTKLRTLAAALVSAVTSRPPPPVNWRSAFDHLLLTVHEQIPRQETAGHQG